jgi:3-hydroxyanthranilate 3,4-dioxygenase
MAKLVPVLNFKKWIEENREFLKPPVGNKTIYNEDFIVMVVGGPNNRKDYHYNQTSEFFYQVEGDMVLKIMNEGIPEDIEIKEGEVYYLPAHVPHSPQRKANTVGLVIEQKRDVGVEDGLYWYCENCNNNIHKEPFTLVNIETDMPVLFDKFYSNKELRTCKECATVMEPPK